MISFSSSKVINSSIFCYFKENAGQADSFPPCLQFLVVHLKELASLTAFLASN